MTDVDVNFFSHLVKDIMEKKQWRQVDLAAHLGLSRHSRATISDWINSSGRILPTNVHLDKLAKAHGGYTTDQLVKMRERVRLAAIGLKVAPVDKAGEILSKDEQALIELARAKDAEGIIAWTAKHIIEKKSKR